MLNFLQKANLQSCDCFCLCLCQANIKRNPINCLPDLNDAWLFFGILYCNRFVVGEVETRCFNLNVEQNSDGLDAKHWHNLGPTGRVDCVVLFMCCVVFLCCNWWWFGGNTAYMPKKRIVLKWQELNIQNLESEKSLTTSQYLNRYSLTLTQFDKSLLGAGFYRLAHYVLITLCKFAKTSYPYCTTFFFTSKCMPHLKSFNSCFKSK